MLGKAFLTGITLFRAGLFPTTLPGGSTAYPGFSSDVQEGVYCINSKDLKARHDVAAPSDGKGRVCTLHQ